MRTQGRITTWNDDKGYGFVSPTDGGRRIFAHIKAFRNRGRRPVVGDVITYSVTRDAQGRPCVAAAAIAGTSAPRRRRRRGALMDLVAVAFLLVVLAAALASAIPGSVLLVYLLASVVTLAVYAWDKSAAKRGDRRIAENTLHLLALAGGWPGAVIAQNRLRHKSRKQPFRSVFWATVVVNCAAFVWLLTPQGSEFWQSLAPAFA